MLPFHPDVGAGLAMLSASPALLFLAVVGLTYVLEDVVAVAAGALAAAGHADPTLLLAALLVGTISGDLALHGIGRLAVRNRRVAAWVDRQCRLKMAGRSPLAIASARVLPGLRFPVYVGSGVAGMDPWKMAAIVTATALVWVPLVFLAGNALLMGPLGIAIGGGAILLVFAVSRHARRRAEARQDAADACP